MSYGRELNFLSKRQSEDDRNQRRNLVRAITFYSQISITMIACILIGVFLGRFLDGFFNTSPWLLLIFSLLGVGAAFKALLDLGQKK